MKLFTKYLKPYIGLCVLVVALVAAQSLAELFLPDLNAGIINEGIINGNIPYIWKKGAVMVVVAITVGAATLGSTYFSTKVQTSFGRDLRLDIFMKVQSFSQADVEKFGTPSLITRTTNDVNQLQQMIGMVMRMMLTAPIMCIGGIVMALKQDVALSKILVFIVPVVFVVMLITMKLTHPMFQKMQTQVDVLNQVLREQLSGVRVIRAFVRAKAEEERYDIANMDMYRVTTKAQRIMNLLQPVTTLLMSFATLAAYYVGAIRVENGMNIGNLTAFITYLAQILMSIQMCSMMFQMIPRAMTCAGRINEVLNTVPTIPEDEEDMDDPIEGKPFESIEFKNVTFAYPDAENPVLNDISFICRAGETTAILGSTGSGKSTLINLVPRFFDVTGGSIEINGIDIRDLPQKELRDRIGFVAQKAFLFEGTIASNLEYGKKGATEEEMWHALEVAQGKDFVSEKPGKLNSEISQGGTNVSGGQRQRLAIARAVIKNPDIYVFDDSFSALDFKTDAKLRQALAKETRGAAVLIVAQRVSTILNADRIIVLDQGHVAGIGTHKELMAGCEVYREIVLSQLSEEEVA